ncbi:sodium-extruding oxaloacetate decarboxylase subunit alpha [Vibrio ostreicida]|uniref:Sodium-extruding oxaloacetate decarboxylase subunit alpha n=1 Tax=Vibrio ostreicida TaxID=526588 RepID=A0ABT8BMG8_9VIBR|nr:sodium-extruding oxaloacetate decarboxylase subunit alpha [Vibrio ostreicida]MDN3608235.1 sodium-extruding oxaloacetate decarboxylase subunit alpha [Vibrio ostreicida]NPD09778.1 sodium-extruding oxaloacetate decarboxylase subunit alpha [Vibrio ostreicida]
MPKPLALTDVVLRDAHQSLFATRLRLDDMLPIAAELDKVGYWSLETWGGATFDACIRYLGEDPWERLRALKNAMPNTPMQMLLRAQNLLGYRHYADDVVEKFVERAHANGMDIFRIFDAMNDVRNFQTAVKATIEVGGHAQGTLSYTTSPVHNIEGWVDLAKRLEDLGCHSLCIKDMSGLLKPYEAQALISRIKSSTDIPLALHSHATTGLSTATAVKAVEAGVDMLDTAISSMSCTYGHTPTEAVVAMLEGTERDTGLKLEHIEPIATYFREVRKKYAQFEGQLKGVDSRILIAQVPGGMLTNMESQLKEQGAADRMDEVLAEIPRVREDLGFIPLVTPTSQIVGTQAVINVLTGERYKSITKETAGVLKGEYGTPPASINATLQARVLDGQEAVTCRPADLLEAEMDTLTDDLLRKASDQNIVLAADKVDDVLTYALFPQVGLKFLKNRHNPDAFEPVPEAASATNDLPNKSTPKTIESYSVRVDGQVFEVEVGPQGELASVKPKRVSSSSVLESEVVPAPLAGNIFKVNVHIGSNVDEGDVLLILEAMKMETEVRAARGGVVQDLHVKEGDSVTVGAPLINLA